MSQYLPDINDLLKTVQQYIKEMSGKLEGGDKYDALVASYLLSICERQLRLGSEFDARQSQDLANFLKSKGDPKDLYQSLCRGIREGKHDENWDELLNLLLAQTANDVAVVRPDHLADIHHPEKT
ncbi:MAG: DUF6285 domain-containing protein [Rhodospirillaceae bacterium]